MKATRTWAEVTARPISTKIHEWILDLVERWGDDRVSDAIEAEGRRIGESGGKLDFGRLLTRVRDNLARADLAVTQEPTEIDGERLLRIVRGYESEPDPPWTWDTRALSAAEYGEVVIWASNRVGRGRAATVGAR